MKSESLFSKQLVQFQNSATALSFPSFAHSEANLASVKLYCGLSALVSEPYNALLECIMVDLNVVPSGKKEACSIDQITLRPIQSK